MEPRQGDIILYPVTGRSNWVSRLVGAAQLALGLGRGFEQYSHAALLDEDMRHQYEAKWPKTGRFMVDRSRVFEVWNVGEPTDAQRRIILASARTHVGEWYNMTGLLTGGLLGLPRTAVCSQFAGYAYAAAGIHINAEAQRILSPNAIASRRGARMVRRYTPTDRRYV